MDEWMYELSGSCVLEVLDGVLVQPSGSFY